MHHSCSPDYWVLSSSNQKQLIGLKMILTPTTIDSEQKGIIKEKGLNNDFVSKEIKSRREICQLSMSGETTHGRCETTLNVSEFKPFHTCSTCF